MSVHIQTLIWLSDIKSPITNIVAIKLADHATDHGENVFPSVDLLVEETKLSRSAVQNARRDLQRRGLLRVIEHGGANGKSTTLLSFDLPALFRLCINSQLGRALEKGGNQLQARARNVLLRYAADATTAPLLEKIVGEDRGPLDEPLKFLVEALRGPGGGLGGPPPGPGGICGGPEPSYNRHEPSEYTQRAHAHARPEKPPLVGKVQRSPKGARRSAVVTKAEAEIHEAAQTFAADHPVFPMYLKRLEQDGRPDIADHARGRGWVRERPSVFFGRIGSS